MALIKCKECKSEVSSKASSCPKCGAKVAAKQYGCGSLIAIGFLGFLIVSIWSGVFSEGNRNNAPSEQLIASKTPEHTVAPAVVGEQWQYSHDTDPMTSGDQYFASVSSSNTVNFDFPYSGLQRGTLSLRNHPRYGKDVIFQIKKGQILCPSYDGCSVLVRFDDQKATLFSASSASDHNSETLFIRNYEKFVQSLEKAKIVRISPEIYKQGTPVFEFLVKGFDKEKFKPTKQAADSKPENSSTHP